MFIKTWKWVCKQLCLLETSVVEFNEKMHNGKMARVHDELCIPEVAPTVFRG